MLKWFSDGSIRTQIIALALAFWLPAMAMLGWLLAVDVKEAHALAYATVGTLATSTSDRINHYLQRTSRSLEYLASRPLVRALNAAHCDPLVDELVRMNAEFADIAVQAADGRPICSFLPKPTPEEDGTEFSRLKDGLPAGTHRVGIATVLPRSHRWVVYMTQPIRDDEHNVVGIVQLAIDLLKLNDQLLSSVPRDAIAAVIDERRSFVLRSVDLASWVGKHPAVNDEYERRFLPDGHMLAKGRDGVLRLFAIQSLPNGWRVAAGLPHDTVMAPERAKLHQAIGVAGVALLLSLGLAWRVSAAVIRPISRLADTAAKVAGGDRSTRAAIEGPAEISAVGRQINVMLDARDRSEALIRESEQHHRIVLSALGEGLLVTDACGTVLHCNPAAERIMGVSEAHWRGHQVVPPQVELLDPQARLPSTGVPSDGLLHLRAPDGRCIWLDFTTRPIPSPGPGNAVGMVTSFSDVTQRTHLDVEVRRHRDQLRDIVGQVEHVSAMKSQFLANMSHEIRTPLNAILGSAQLLQRRGLDEEQQRLVGSICTAGRALLERVNEVLDFSRIEAGRLQIEHRPFDLRKVLADIVRVLAPSAQAKGLWLVLEPLPHDLPALAGDAQRLDQVIYNLVGNAIKFTDTGGVTVEARTLRQELGQVELRLIVRDSGIGIAVDKIDHIFDPFMQVDSSTTRRYGGTGLGLAICRQLVTLMGGEIGASSQPGAGSEFWLHLSFGVADAPTAAAETKALPAAWSRFQLDGIRVLVVDDVLANSDIAQRLLESEGAICFCAHDGHEALRGLRDMPDGIDVVLLDIQMPGMDGLEVTRRMRTDAALADMPVIALTAGALPSQREQALAAGMDDFLAKPLELDALVDAILRWSAPRHPGLHSVPAMAPAACVQGEAFPVIDGIDGQRAQRRFMGDRALFLRLLHGLRDDHADVVEVVRAEVKQGELAQAAFRVHKLCGLAGNLSADALAGAAAQLEGALRAQRLDAIDSLLQTLSDALSTVIQALPAQIETTREEPHAAVQGSAMEQMLPKHMAPLLAAVQINDTSALDHFEELRDLLTERHGADGVARLVQALFEFRFDEAHSLLQGWGYQLHGDEQCLNKRTQPVAVLGEQIN